MATLTDSTNLTGTITLSKATGTKVTLDTDKKYLTKDIELTINAPSSTITTNGATVNYTNGWVNAGSTTVTDSNLIASNIKKETTIFGVTGTFDNSVNVYQDNEGYVVLDKEGPDYGYKRFAKNPQLIFIDYDGTELQSYTAAEAQALTELPPNPSHGGLIAQGWNWTLTEIKNQLQSCPNSTVYVGQLYTTASGATEIDIELTDNTKLSPILHFSVNSDSSATIDWGDNSALQTATATGDFTHTYNAIGNYTIKIQVITGTCQIFGSDATYALLRKNDIDAEHRVYSNTIKAVRMGNNMNIYTYAFRCCTSLRTITIPSTINTLWGYYPFYYCYSLISITLPHGMTSLGKQSFYTCYSLKSISIPYNLTTFGDRSMYGCNALEKITIPVSTTTFASTAALQNCYSLTNLILPPNVSTINANTFTNCRSLGSLTIPSYVSTIGDNAFSNCYGITQYHFTRSSPATAGTTIFANIVSDCIIYVPKGKLTAYQGATNWAEYASYMQEEPS